MATIRLIPSAYTLSSTQYLQISNATNMYANTDNTTYAQVTHNRANTTAYYLYIHNFDFSSVPSDAEVQSIEIKIKALESGLSTNSSYRMSLYNGSTSIASTTCTSSLSTTATTYSFPIPSTLTWSTIKGYGNNFRIRVPLRRNSSDTSGYVRVYGAEIVVTTSPKWNVTSTLTGNGTISPSGTHEYSDGEEYTLYVIPANSGASVSATLNGNAISLTHHAAGSETISATAESFTTGFSTTGINFYTSASSQGHNFNYAVGHTAENPGSTSSGSGSWTYVKTSSGSTTGTGYADFEFDFSEIPAGATINSVTVKCYGAVESASQSTSHSDITLYSGSTQKGTTQKFTSSTNGIITLSNIGTWTRDELQEAKLRFAVGYYGGHLFGITWTVSYSAPENYSYSYTVHGNDTIAVTIGTAAQPKLYIKVDNTWKEVTTAYKKVNGTWVVQSDITTVFNSNNKYRRQ